MSIHLHIVPSVPPAFNGLGDYCYQLWKHWPEPRPEWHVATAQLPSGAQEAWPEAVIHPFAMSRDGLLHVLTESKAETVVLHYVGYGYAQRGAPSWLPEALKLWKKKSGGKLVVMFHELYATGAPWKSEFWFCLAQKSVAAKLAQLADQWITSCPRYFTILPEGLGAKPDEGVMIPIPSTIEPVADPDFERHWPLDVEKKLCIAVFGMPLTRLRALRSHRGVLGLLVSKGLVEQIVLIGRADSEDQTKEESHSILRGLGASLPIAQVFDKPSTEVSEVLRGCHLGLVSNQLEILTKSTVFAAHACHGVLSLIPGPHAESGPAYVVNNDAQPDKCVHHLSMAFREVKSYAHEYSGPGVAKRFAEAVRRP